MKEKPSILILNTGGTIGMMMDPRTKALKPVNFNNLFDLIPTLKLFNYNIDHYCFDPLIDSSNMNPETWANIARVIEKKYELYDGFVVLHGSDTMAYTASALSFMLHNLNKPVVLTGSQLPLGMIRTDGRENLLTSVEIAAAKDEETPVVPEVCIYFENQLFRGNRTHKFNAQNFEAFRSFNYPALADAGVTLDYHKDKIRKPNFKKLKVYDRFDDNVTILKMYPGISPNAVASIFDTKNLKALILETYGSGNAPDYPWFIELLKNAIDSGILVVNVTQCQVGTVEMGKYETSIALRNAGVISGFDITTEAAVTKLMHLFGNNKNTEDVKVMFLKPIAGEMTEA
ncbi:MAG: asparaginase [Bacteroidales bacterium]|nr:asparaginase [Bacteroidales bacterium]